MGKRVIRFLAYLDSLVVPSEADWQPYAQAIHADPAPAAKGPFGGVIASGWHTTAITMRIVAAFFLNDKASLASPGVDELRWIHPVRPGDVLSARFEILEARPLAVQAGPRDRPNTRHRVQRP